MRILSVLTYYRPHTSGLTIYAERLAKAFAEKGHQVTILTSRYSPSLKKEEVLDGVRIIRAPVFFRISKGVIMPTFGFLASKLVLSHDVIQLHLPQFDAAGIAMRGRLFKKPTVVTYHCDLQMPEGFLNLAANLAVLFMNHLAAMFTHSLVTYTQDYAENSPLLKRYLHKVHIIPPPIELPGATHEQITKFSRDCNLSLHHPVIGMATRFATEKGVEVLLDAFPTILECFPDAIILFAGAYQNIIGEEKYFERLKPSIQEYEQSGHWRFLGNLSPLQMAAFYPNLDVLVVPSLNSTESFGLVQIEAMINGVPSIASDLPGVRQPTVRHHMGKVIPVGDSKALADAVIEIQRHRGDYHRDAEEIKQQYLPATIAQEYEGLFFEIARSLRQKILF